MIADVKFPPGTIGAYALSNSGTISRFHSTSNPYAAPVAWTDTDLDNLYQRIVPETNGLNVYVQGISDGDTPTDEHIYWDLRVAQHGLTIGDYLEPNPPDVIDIGFVGSWVSGAGFRTQWVENYFGDFDADFIRVVLPNVPSLASIRQLIVYSSAAISGITTPDYKPVMSPIFPVPDFTESFPDGDRGAVYTLYQWDSDVDARGRSITISYLTGDGNHTDITGIDFESTSPSSGIITRYSPDSGATFEPIKLVGIVPSLGYVGMDTQKIGNVALAGAGSQVFKAVSGGDWADFGGTIPAGAQPNAIFIPRWQFGGTIVGNTGSNPQYLLGSGTLSNSGESLWKVTSAGSLFTAISPKINGTAGLIVSPSALSMEWNSGTDISAIANFSGSVKLCVSNNTGAGWKFTDLDDSALAVVGRRSDLQHAQNFVANGDLGGYVANIHLGTIVNTDKHSPANVFHAIDVYN